MTDDDDKTTRREFFRGLVPDERDGDDHGWQPGFQPKTEQEIEQNRRQVREQIGDIEQPEDKPFDALNYLEQLAAEDEDQEDEEPSQQSDAKQTFVVHRPPRALAEQQFLDACTRCGDCVDACPHDAIELASPRFRDAEGTPRIDPSQIPCYMCEDTPCVDACEPDALSADVGLSMGDAEIHEPHCLAHRGEFCTTCSEHCPMPGAIKIRDGKPAILSAACTGCGVCFHVCPAPINAVRIYPQGRPDGGR